MKILKIELIKSNYYLNLLCILYLIMLFKMSYSETKKNIGVVEYHAGLGNQLFQYCFGYILRNLTGQTVLYTYYTIDRSIETCRKKKFHNIYGLIHFNAHKNNEIISNKKLIHFFSNKLLSPEFLYEFGIYKKMGNTSRIINFNFIPSQIRHQKFNINYDKNHSSIAKLNNNNLYLFGHWTGYSRYYKKFRNDLLKQLTLNEKLDQKNEQMLTKIKSYKNSISMHIRRGDYIFYRNGKYLLDYNYYQMALKKLYEKVNIFDDGHVFIFTNDHEWFKNNTFSFGIPIKFTLVDLNDEVDGYKDMWLMKHCKHNIMAASTFSWWGAWLNENPNKVIICPSMYPLCYNMKFENNNTFKIDVKQCINIFKNIFKK